MFSAFYSDPHYGHANIIGYASRPFLSLDHMHDRLTDYYNKIIRRDDCVLWLGDVFFGPPDKAEAFVKSLHGTKVLIRGNHDKRRSNTFFKKIGFLDVVRSLELKIAGRDCLAQHYPYVNENGEWVPKRIPGRILLHGHTHSPRKILADMVHLGVDAWNYAPALYNQVEALVRSIDL